MFCMPHLVYYQIRERLVLMRLATALVLIFVFSRVLGQFVTISGPKVVTSLTGENVTFNCNATDLNESVNNTIAFYGPSNELVGDEESGQATSLSASLTISNVRNDDSGAYTCRVTSDDVILFNETVVLQVIESPDGLVVIEPSMIIAEHNSDVTFTCRTNSGPIGAHTFMWNDTFESIGTGPVLSLSNINSSVGGTYYCTVINEAGTGVESVDLFVTPKIITHPVGIVANTFDIVPALTCTAQSFPDSEYRWEKSETFGDEYFEIPDSEGSSLDYANSLLSFGDSGYYRCIAYTNVSGIINETASDPAVITVNPDGSVIMFPIPLAANGGGNATFTCLSLSISPSNLIWKFNGSVLSNGGRYEIAQYYLTIAGVVGEDHGLYTCELTNLAGSSSTSSSLIVSPEGLSSISPVNNVTLNRGDNVTLQCSTTAGPDNKHNWFQILDSDNATVTDQVGTESTLELLSVNASHGGSYECRVSNDAGSEALSTDVFILPYFVEQPPTNVTAAVGEDVTIDECNAESYPPPTFQWQKFDGTKFVTLPGQEGSSLELTSVTADDLGHYRCVVQPLEFDSAPIASDVVTVYVSPHGLITVQPSELITEHNSEVSFSCNTTAGPGNEFVWAYVTGDSDSVNFTSSHDFMSNENITVVVLGSVLTLSNVDTSVAGTYYCAVINAAGFDTETANLYITPNITTHPVGINASNGDSVPALTCMADSFPDPEYRWEKRNSLKDEYSKIPDSDGSSLSYTDSSIFFGDSGYYRCIAYTNVSGIINETASDPAIVSVSPSGGTSVSPSTLTASGGDNVSIECTAQGGPDNMLAWKFNGSVLSNGGRHTVTLFSLTIAGVVGEDHGLYTCEATNFAGIGNSTSSLTVSPEGFSSISPVNNVTLNRGDDITLQCTTTAGPDNKFKWFQIVATENATVGTESFLELSSVNASHGGSYECRVSNDAGSEALSTNVFILPYFVEQPPANVTASVGGNATIKCNAESFPLPTFQWQKFDGTNFVTLSGQENSSLELTSVTADDLGQYRCVVLTKELDPEPIISNISTLYVSPRGLVTVQPSELIAGHDSEVLLTCSTTAGPDNSFHWLYGTGDSKSEDLISVSDISNSNLTTVGTSSVLTLRNINSSVGGTYYCVVVNEAGEGVDSAKLYITPDITTHPVGINASNGDSVPALTCMANSFPDPEYRWERRNSSEDEYSEIPNSEGSSLSYADSSISFGDSGYYRCIAYTNVSGIINETASDPAIISVRPSGGVWVSPSTLTASGGDNVSIECTAQGGPDNMLAWKFNGSVLSNGGRYTVTPFSLTIAGVVGEDHGLYTCEATNFAGIGNSTSSLTVSPEGFSTISPVNNVTLNRGDDITLQCTTTAGPDNTFKWFQIVASENATVGTESFLDLSSVSASHGGTYECRVSNDAGSEALSTDVFVRPYFVEQPAANVYTETGQNVTLDCNAESFPPPTFQWEKKDDNGNFVALSGETGRYLVYISVTNDVIGEYHCVVRTQELGSTITSDNSHIHVSPVGFVMTTPQNVTVGFGDSVTLNCSTATGPNNTFVWLRNRTASELNVTEIESFAISRSSVLTLTNITAPRDGGYYQCVIINEAGYGFDTSTVFVRPYFILHPQSVEITANTEWSLTCDAEGFPFPFIKWQKMNRASQNFEDYMNARGTTLTFSSIVHDDFGMYRCVAINVINGEENIAVSNPALITVSPEGSMAIDPQNETFNYSESARLDCSANGGPNNIFTWFLNDTVIESGSNNITIASTSFTSMLNISSVYAPRHGGTYTCMASNAAGSANISTDVFVSLRFLIRPAPVQLLVTNGDSHTFTCEAESYPVPMYTWRKGDVTVGPTDYRYPFNPVVFGDEGEYKCIATSNSQSIESLFTIYISPLTSARSDPNVTNSFVNMSVTFNCSALGGPNNHYFWSYQRTDTTLSNTNILTIVSHASHGGTYECTVGNSAGYDIAIATLNVGPEVLIHPSPQNVTIFVENIVLYCLVSGYPFPQIAWYLNDTQLFPESDGRINITTVDSPDLIPGYDSTGEFSGSGLSNFNLGTGMDSLNNRNPFNVNLDIGDIRDPFGTVSSRLVIKNTTISDSGMYHCEAVINNIYNDKTSDSVLVLVQAVPDEPLAVSSTAVTSRSVNLTWTIPHHNNAPILGYYIFYTCPSFLASVCTEVTLLSFASNFQVTMLHPGVIYSFTVLAFNEKGNSSQSLPYTVQTTEEAPGGPPTMVRGPESSQTEIVVVWKQPEVIDRHGVITSYDVMYTPLLDNCTEEEFKGIPANCTPKFVYGVTGENTTLTGLYIFVNYSIEVRARTAIGPGPWSSPIIVLTNPSIPGNIPMPPPVPREDIGSTEVLVRWEPPVNPNGIIQSYTVTANALRAADSTLPSSLGQRKRREVDTEVQRCLDYLIQTDNQTERLNNGTVVVSVPGNTHQALLTPLVPFTLYQFAVQASTFLGTSMSSPFQNFSTLNDVPSSVENLIGGALDSTKIILLWVSPSCPNGILSGYHVYYIENDNEDERLNSSVYTNETLLVTSAQLKYIVSDLTPLITYRIHVRAFSDSFLGSVDTEISVELKISITAPVTVTDNNGRPVNVIDTSSSGISSLTFFLPTASALATASILINEVNYYAVVVVPHPKSSFNIARDDFDTAYPNLQPYDSRGSNSYYITAAWNDPNDVPNSFNVGDEVTRIAVRNGRQETYLNAKLSRGTQYCVYIIINGRWNRSNDTFVRVYEHICTETRLGYNLIALIVLLPCAVIVLCCAFWIMIVCCKCCRRRRSRRNWHLDFALDTYPYFGEREDTIMGKSSIRIRDSFKTPAAVTETEMVVHTNFETDFKDKGPISVAEFPAVVSYMHQNGDFRFSEEFSRIEPIHTSTHNASLHNKEKNRFPNILAYDHSRVVLEHCPSGSDYINASYIAGYDENSGSYIATQGPLANTANDFWCMIWEREVPVIVMLTSLVEKDKVKCHQYWPKSATEGENVLEYSSFRVTLLEEDVNEHFVNRKISLEMIGDKKKKIVNHYQFTSWPDHGAPSSSGPLLEFMDRINQTYTPYDGPMTVHCSAGVGRTGTFIAIMVEMARIKSEEMVDIYNFVRYMRTRRPMMVMNEIEYILIHDALVNALKLVGIEGMADSGSEVAKRHEESFKASDTKNLETMETKL